MDSNSASSSTVFDGMQAWAAVAAILAGFAYVAFQRWSETAAAGRAAGHLARHSLNFATDRLEALIDPSKPIGFALRGARATEMIEVFRELEVSKLPPQMIQSVAVIRSGVYAINNRIDEVLKDDGKRQAERRSRLHSAGRTLAEVREQFAVLKMHYRPWNRKKFTLNALSDRMAVFLMEAKQALQQPAQTHRP